MGQLVGLLLEPELLPPMVAEALLPALVVDCLLQEEECFVAAEESERELVLPLVALPSLLACRVATEDHRSVRK